MASSVKNSYKWFLSFFTISLFQQLSKDFLWLSLLTLFCFTWKTFVTDRHIFFQKKFITFSRFFTFQFQSSQSRKVYGKAFVQNHDELILLINFTRKWSEMSPVKITVLKLLVKNQFVMMWSVVMVVFLVTLVSLLTISITLFWHIRFKKCTFLNYCSPINLGKSYLQSEHLFELFSLQIISFKKIHMVV